MEPHGGDKLPLTECYNPHLTQANNRSINVGQSLNVILLVLNKMSVPGDGGLFRLHNVIIIGYVYYLILLTLLHVSVVRPSSSRITFAGITRLTTDPLFLDYS
jgi:hypothetical protein